MPPESFYKDAEGRPGRRRIGGHRGGSDPGPGKKSGSGKKTGGGAAAVAVAGAILASSGGLSGVGGTGALDANIGATRAIQERVVQAEKSASRGKRKKAWRKMRLRRTTKNKIEHHLKCAAYSHGQVRDFFLRTPCSALKRELFAVADGNGDVIVVSIAQIRMRHATDMWRLRRLIDVYGTGDVYPLGTQLIGLVNIHFTGKHYASRPSGSTLVAEAEPAEGHPPDELLNGIARLAAQFPAK